MLHKSIIDTAADSWTIYLTGEGNFRYEIYPEYKAHRLKQPVPRHLKSVKEHVARSWPSILAEGCEADDLLGLHQTDDTCICSIDKDLNQIAGRHYHPGLPRKGKWIVEPHFYEVSPKAALYFFYYQLLVGDSTDNIKGAPGIGKTKAENILFGCEDEWDYYQACLPFFSCEEELLLNARCVKIGQTKDSLWLPPVDRSTET